MSIASGAPHKGAKSQDPSPLLRLSLSGWCRVAERLAMTDDAVSVVPSHEAAVREATGEVVSAPLPNPVGLKDHLKRQALSLIPRRSFGIAANLIEEIDAETGLFFGGLHELAIALGRPEDDLADILTAINHMWPGGCGAASYQQALRCQIPELPGDYSGEVARLLLTDYWETFSQGGREILSEISGLGYQAIEDGVDAIRTHLTPYPAERFWGRNGSHLKRGHYHVSDGGDRQLVSPMPSEWCFTVKKGAGTESSLLALDALRLRRRAFAGIGEAFANADFDDPELTISLESFAEYTDLSQWAAWIFADGELIVDAAGERRYIREMLHIGDEGHRRLLFAIDREISAGKASSDAELAAVASTAVKPLNVKDTAAMRKLLGVPGRAARGNPLIRHLLSYNSYEQSP